MSTFESSESGRELAIALGYRPNIDAAPRILATGQGLWAKRIRALANRHRIPIQEEGGLADLLAQVPLGEQIPAELYPAVAEIFAFLKRLGEGIRNTDQK